MSGEVSDEVDQPDGAQHEHTFYPPPRWMCVTITRARPIDALYEAVAGYDLVVVPDPPLAAALNRRIDRPRLGPFAITPRRHVDRRRERDEDRLAFIEVIEHTDLGWKEAATAVGEVLQCWEHMGTVDAVLDVPGYDREAVRRVVEVLAAADITSGRLRAGEIDTEEYPNVAVIGEDLLTPLERSMLLPEFDRIDLFTEETADPPSFEIFDSPAATVDAAVDQLSPAVAGDVGIVLEAGSEYATLLESALESAGVPYYGGPGFADDRDLRHFIALLRTVFGGSDVRVRDVQAQLAHLDIEVDVAHEEKRLFEVRDPALSWVWEFHEASVDRTLGEALAAYEGVIGEGLPRFREELETLDVLANPLTEELLDRLVFYLQTYDIPVERDDEGVLLADATSAMFVDRPTVFYLGLDEGWSQATPRRPWIDRGTEYERHSKAFQSLIQSGRQRQYLVVDVAGGRPITPAIYFEDLLDGDFERFSDLGGTRYPRRPIDGQSEFEYKPLAVKTQPEPIATISQSSLNRFVASPRAYLFDRLLDGPDRSYLAEGTLFHDFAEFYVTNRDLVDTASGRPDPEVLAELADLMVEEMRPFYREFDLAPQRTRYRAGLETIATYLATHDLSEHPESSERLDRWDENVFATAYDRRAASSIAERRFEDEDLQLKGTIDVFLGPDHLGDFKSGGKKTAAHLTKRSTLDPPHEHPNFQALLYLTYLRATRSDAALEFTFVHFLECLDDVITGTPTLEDCTTTITYRPETYNTYIRSEAVFEQLCGEASNACNKTFAQVEHGTFLAVLEDHPIPKTRYEDELLESDFRWALEERMQAAIGPYKYVEKGCAQACRYLVTLRQENFFADDLDAFERFVAERIRELNGYRNGDARFPVVGLVEKQDLDRVDHRDLLLEEEIPASDPGDAE